MFFFEMLFDFAMFLLDVAVGLLSVLIGIYVLGIIFRVLVLPAIKLCFWAIGRIINAIISFF